VVKEFQKQGEILDLAVEFEIIKKQVLGSVMVKPN
jgi:hypothetical protein